MNLENICRKIAKKELSKPGTMVECMKKCAGIYVGNVYKVNPKEGTPNFLGIFYGKSSTDSWFADRFRKVGMS